MSFYSRFLQEREIRLVSIVSAELSNPVEISLQTVYLNEDPSYEALSYVWGDPNPPCTISVEREHFTVTPNLETALRHLRYPDRPRTMWIDAICINQDIQSPEKSEQVALMGDIYATASNTVVFIGDNKENSNFALDTITEINNELQQQLDDGTRNRSNFHSTLDLGETSFFRRQVAAEVPLDPTPWVAINCLLRRQWWRRVWTQEVIMPKHNIEIVCGMKSVSWVAFHRVTLMLARHDFGKHWPILFAGHNLFYAVQPIHTIRETWRTDIRDHTLLANLVFFYYRDCTDPLDKVDAVFSLSSDVIPEKLPINYQCSVQKLFTDAAAFFKTSNRAPKFLTLCQSNGRMQDLPSWVPDWSIEQMELERLNMDLKLLPPEKTFLTLLEILSKERRPPVPLGNWIGSTNHSFAAATSIPQSTVVLESDSVGINQQRLLPIEGLTHSRVHCIGRDGFQPLKQPVWHWLELVVPHIGDPYSTGESRLEALWRTLVTNCASNMQVAKRNMFEKALSAEATERIDAGIRDPRARIPLGSTFMLGFAPLLYRAMSGRRFFVTDNGFMGLAPADVKERDRISLLFGVEVPVVLRNHENGTMEVMGACYCHGIMESEGSKDYSEGRVESETFLLS